MLRTETLEALCHLCDAIAQITNFSVANYQVKWAEKQSQSRTSYPISTRLYLITEQSTTFRVIIIEDPLQLTVRFFHTERENRAIYGVRLGISRNRDHANSNIYDAFIIWVHIKPNGVESDITSSKD